MKSLEVLGKSGDDSDVPLGNVDNMALGRTHKRIFNINIGNVPGKDGREYHGTLAWQRCDSERRAICENPRFLPNHYFLLHFQHISSYTRCTFRIDSPASSAASYILSPPSFRQRGFSNDRIIHKVNTICRGVNKNKGSALDYPKRVSWTFGRLPLNASLPLLTVWIALLEPRGIQRPQSNTRLSRSLSDPAL